MVVETMKKEHLSIHATMQEFGINDHKIIERWERIYLEEGPEGLSVERRGRSSTGRSKKLPKEVEEDLLAEVQRLRAENDYLKNLQALIYALDRDAAAEVVQRIYHLCLEGKGPEQIARLLQKEKVLNPTAYYYSVGSSSANRPMPSDPYLWKDSTIDAILSNRKSPVVWLI